MNWPGLSTGRDLAPRPGLVPGELGWKGSIAICSLAPSSSFLGGLEPDTSVQPSDTAPSCVPFPWPVRGDGSGTPRDELRGLLGAQGRGSLGAMLLHSTSTLDAVILGSCTCLEDAPCHPHPCWQLWQLHCLVSTEIQQNGKFLNVVGG